MRSPRRGLTIDALVNNAGYGVPGAYVASPWERHDAMLQVMVVAVAELTHRLLPGMIERGYGRIINVASLAALVPAPAGHTLYAASKAFVDQVLRVAGRGGAAAWRARDRALSRVHLQRVPRRHRHARDVSRLPSWLWMEAAQVAREGFDAVMAGTPVHVTGRVTRAIATLGCAIILHGLVSAVNRRFAVVSKGLVGCHFELLPSRLTGYAAPRSCRAAVGQFN